MSLSSLHVDEEPGDRASDCGGIMEPVAVWVRKGGDGRMWLSRSKKRKGRCVGESLCDTAAFLQLMGMIRIISPCAIKSTRNSWIFSDCFFFIAQIGKNSADSYAPNEDENAQKSYQISRCSIQNIAIGIRTAKHIRYSVDFLYISQLKDWR